MIAALLVMILASRLLPGAHGVTPESISKIGRGGRTTVQNAMWGADAFPTSPQLHPGKNLSVGYFNSPGGGRLTLIHIVLFGEVPRPLIRRHVALALTYDDLPYKSVFVPIGDFFIEHEGHNGTVSSCFETHLLASRPTNSWYSYFHIPYRHSLRVELIGSSDLPNVVGGEVWLQHEDTPFVEGDDAYFHALFSHHPSLRFPWQPVVFSPPEGGWIGPGALVGVSMRFSAPAEWAEKFGGAFDHVCEGNYELYVDNTTALLGNDTYVDIAAEGYQASEHVIVVTGSEDFFGYSFGWKGQMAGALSGTPLWAQTQAGHDLATYRFFDTAPIRFATSLSAQVNWGFDIGHNVPFDLCPASGCIVEYDVLSYLYLAEPADASPWESEFPWESPQ